MEESSTSVPATIFLIATFVIFLYLYIASKKKYSQYLGALNKDIFPLKDIMGIGFYLMEIVKYKYNTKIDRQLRRKLVELHDENYTEFYLQSYRAASATYLIVGILFTSIFTALTGEIAIVFVGLIITFVLAHSVISNIDERIEQKHLLITLDFPDLVNKIIILSGAGLTLRAAWIKISKEMNADTPLYLEVAKVTTQMESGINDIVALENMTTRCNMPEMRRFISVIIQNFQRGGTDVFYALDSLSKEMWENRKAKARVFAEEAGTKILFPMMLMFLAVVIMTMAPAILSINMSL